MSNVTGTHDDELKIVKLPSGATFQVYAQEVKYFQDRAKQYMTDNLFTNITDLQDLDRILMGELLTWRYSNWVSRQRDYWDEPVDEGTFNKYVKELDGQLRSVKSSLGLDKVSRDKQRGEDALSTYIERLGIRAKAFGVTREKMLQKALELEMDLIAKVTLYFNCDAQERKEMGCEAEDILTFLRDEHIPKFQAVDEHFRRNDQKFWVRSQ